MLLKDKKGNIRSADQVDSIYETNVQFKKFKRYNVKTSKIIYLQFN